MHPPRVSIIQSSFLRTSYDIILPLKSGSLRELFYFFGLNKLLYLLPKMLIQASLAIAVLVGHIV